jgi:hypothetical protein
MTGALTAVTTEDNFLPTSAGLDVGSQPKDGNATDIRNISPSLSCYVHYSLVFNISILLVNKVPCPKIMVSPIREHPCGV